MINPLSRLVSDDKAGVHYLHISSEYSNLGIVLEFVSWGGSTWCFSVRMNYHNKLFHINRLPLCIVRIHQVSISILWI